MKTSRTPTLLLGLLYACFLCYLAFSAAQLPDRVAAHFDLAGRADGWMSRSAWLLSMLLFGFVFPLFVPALFFVLRFMPAGGFNIPHRDYWLAADRRAETFAFLFRHSLWFACAAIGFVCGIQFLTIEANRHSPAQLSTPMMCALAGCFVAGIVVWIIRMFLYFRQRPPND